MNKTPQTGYGLRTYKYPPDYDPSLNEIGGWLILVIIGRLLTIYDIFNLPSLLPYFGYAPILDIYLIITVCFDLIGELALSILIIVFIFFRKIMFRKLYIIQCSLQIIFLFFTMFFFSGYGADIGWNIWASAIVFGVIFIPYLFLSKRVKNTYIYPDLFLSYDGMYGYAARYPSNPSYGAGASDQVPEKTDVAPEAAAAGTADQVPEKADSSLKTPAKPTADGSYYIKDILVPDSKLVECPVCNSVQHNKRKSCYKCGAKFIQ